MDGISALYRAALAHDTSVALTGTRTIPELTAQGIGALAGLAGI